MKGPQIPPVADVTQAGPDELAADDVLVTGLGDGLAGDEVLVTGSGVELAGDEALAAGPVAELDEELAMLVAGSGAELDGDDVLAVGLADVVEPDCCFQLATIELGGHLKKAPNADTRVSFPDATQAKTCAPEVDPPPTPYRAVHRAGTELAGHFGAPATET